MSQNWRGILCVGIVLLGASGLLVATPAHHPVRSSEYGFGKQCGPYVADSAFSLIDSMSDEVVGDVYINQAEGEIAVAYAKYLCQEDGKPRSDWPKYHARANDMVFQRILLEVGIPNGNMDVFIQLEREERLRALRRFAFAITDRLGLERASHLNWFREGQPSDGCYQCWRKTLTVDWTRVGKWLGISEPLKK